MNTTNVLTLRKLCNEHNRLTVSLVGRRMTAKEGKELRRLNEAISQILNNENQEEVSA